MANIKLPKTQLHKIGQPGGFLSRLLEPLLKTGLPLIAKRALISLRLMAAASTADVAIH